MTPSLPSPRRAPARGKRAFAATWWGQAWVAALEDSSLDAGRLSRGRTYARKGMVGPTTVAPGQIKAPVQGSRPRPYRSAVHLPVLTNAQWDTLLDTIAARAGHLAALLDGEMPTELVDDTRHTGVPCSRSPPNSNPNAPAPTGDTPANTPPHSATPSPPPSTPTRSCSSHCAAAVVRRSSPSCAHSVRQHRRPQPHRHRPAIPAAAAYARWAEESPELPELPEPAAHATALPVAPPPGTGLAAADLERLMADATARAARLLAGATADLYLTQHQDAVRIAASSPGPEWFHHLIRNTGTKPTAFARLTRAWRHGGPTGITVAEQPYTPDPTVMKAARTSLGTALAEMADSPHTSEPGATASPSPTTASSCVWAPTPAGTPTSRTTTANGGPQDQPTVTRSPRSPRPGRRTGGSGPALHLRGRVRARVGSRAGSRVRVRVRQLDISVWHVPGWSRL